MAAKTQLPIDFSGFLHLTWHQQPMHTIRNLITWILSFVSALSLYTFFMIRPFIGDGWYTIAVLLNQWVSAVFSILKTREPFKTMRNDKKMALGLWSLGIAVFGFAIFGNQYVWVVAFIFCPLRGIGFGTYNPIKVNTIKEWAPKEFLRTSIAISVTGKKFALIAAFLAYNRNIGIGTCFREVCFLFPVAAIAFYLLTKEHLQEKAKAEQDSKPKVEEIAAGEAEKVDYEETSSERTAIYGLSIAYDVCYQTFSTWILFYGPEYFQLADPSWPIPAKIGGFVCIYLAMKKAMGKDKEAREGINMAKDSKNQTTISLFKDVMRQRLPTPLLSIALALSMCMPNCPWIFKFIATLWFGFVNAEGPVADILMTKLEEGVCAPITGLSIRSAVTAISTTVASLLHWAWTARFGKEYFYVFACVLALLFYFLYGVFWILAMEMEQNRLDKKKTKDE